MLLRYRFAGPHTVKTAIDKAWTAITFRQDTLAFDIATAKEPRAAGARRLVNQWAADHCHTLAGGQPILALDMYEHSYHIDYGAKAATYVDTFMDAIRWSNADRVYASVAKP